MNSQLEDAYYGDIDPTVVLKKETNRHRLICFLAAEGHSTKEISEKIGMTPMSVSNILRQPWARERVQTEIRLAGQDEIRSILEAQVKPSLERLVTLRDTAESEQVQKAAADSLLDRFLGKATQPFRDDTTKANPNMTDAELEEIARQEATRTATTQP